MLSWNWYFRGYHDKAFKDAIIHSLSTDFERQALEKVDRTATAARIGSSRARGRSPAQGDVACRHTGARIADPVVAIEVERMGGAQGRRVRRVDCPSLRGQTGEASRCGRRESVPHAAIPARHCEVGPTGCAHEGSTGA